jgi:hypothetical protein
MGSFAAFFAAGAVYRMFFPLEFMSRCLRNGATVVFAYLAVSSCITTTFLRRIDPGSVQCRSPHRAGLLTTVPGRNFRRTCCAISASSFNLE